LFSLLGELYGNVLSVIRKLLEYVFGAVDYILYFYMYLVMKCFLTI